MEASGTGNMKLALNGALTIGTLDGANVEIKERVGDDNIFIFGLTTPQVEARRREGVNARDLLDASPTLGQVLEQVRSGVFSHAHPELYQELVGSLLDHDHFMVLADFEAYAQAQAAVAARWRDQKAWRRSSIINTANMGWFSSDRTIAEYAEEIWGAQTLAQPPKR
jgi:starch phosphorylase